MNETLYKELEPTQTIDNALPQIIESFVAFYGEENREEIENKFKNLLIIGYGLPDRLNSILYNIKENKTKELIQKFFDDAKINTENIKELTELLFSTTTLDYPSSIPFQRYVDYKKESRDNSDYEHKKKRALEFLKKINPNVTLENMEELEQNGAFSDLDKLIPLYENMMNLYLEELSKIKVYADEAQYNESLKRGLEHKYFAQLLNEFSDVIPSNELEEINNCIKSGYISVYSLPKIKSYFGSSVSSTPLIDAFSKKNEELLITGKEWQKNSIKRDRIEFFKNMGINLGDDYSLYENNPECKKIIPSQDFIDKISSRKKELSDKLLNEYYKSTKEYQRNRKRINEANLLIKDDGYDANAYFNGGTFVCPNIILVNGKYYLLPIMCINMNMLEYLDVSVIHELNHVFELDLKNVDEDICDFTCGWDILQSSLKDTPDEIQKLEKRDDKREYELFSEIINELIAQDITNILHNNGAYVFNNASNAKIKGGTSYEKTLFLVRDFYATYKKEILKTRKTRNMKPLFDKVGKENFDALNNLFDEFYEHLGGMKYYSLVDDLKAKRDTNLTRKYFELISKRDKILTAMNEYSNEYQSENQK